MQATSNQQYSDSEVIAGLIAGGVSFQKYSSHLYFQWRGYIFKVRKQYPGLSEEELNDAYTDALDALIKTIIQGKFDQGRSKLSTLLYQILSNKCIDRVRKNTNQKSEWQKNLREIVPELPIPSQDFLQSLFNQDELNGLMDLMDQLNPPCKELIIDFDYWGYLPDEVALRHGYKNGKSASQAKYRCMEGLRKLIQLKDQKAS